MTVRERDPSKRDDLIPEAREPAADTPAASPPAGPHADLRLIDPDKTPGSGAFPTEDGGGDVDPGAG